MTMQGPIHATSREPDQPAGANGRAGTAPAKAPMTADGLEAARGELARLRRSSRLEIEHRLREARAYGDGSNNDEHHAVREDQMSSRPGSLDSTGLSPAPRLSIRRTPNQASRS
jgi:Transcription elongation factor, N-terminal